MGMRLAIRLLAAALLALPAGACGSDSDGDSDSSSGGGPPPGTEGPTLTYGNGHPLNWLTDDPTTLQFEDEVVSLVNAHRASLSRAPLVHDPVMRACARGHSRHMTQPIHDFFAHDNPEGESPFQRMTANGIAYSSAGENIAAGYSTPAAVMAAWLSSPGHRANIESASYGRIGVGYAPGTTSAYWTYWTQVFAN